MPERITQIKKTPICIYIPALFQCAFPIFRAVKGAVTGEPQNRDYRGEARKACEKVTPKKSKDATPPWEG